MDLRYWVSQYGDYLGIMEEIRATIPKVWADIQNRQPVPTAINGAKNEVIVLNTKVELGLITENLDKVKGSIEEYAKQFEGLKFTEEQYSEAKDFRKELNSQIKLIDDARKSVKKQWTEPLEAFEKKCKELSAIIEKVKTPIEEQINDFETKEKEDKKKDCDKLIELALQVLPENYQDIISKSGGIAFDNKWLNRTTKLNAVKKEIETIVETEKANLDLFFSAVMASTSEGDADAVMNAFIENKRNVNAALQTKNRIEQMRAERERREAEARAQEALRRAQMEAQRQQVVEEPKPTSAPVVEPSPAPANPAPKQQIVAKLIMEVSHPNKDKFAELAKFMTDNGFTFRRID